MSKLQEEINTLIFHYHLNDSTHSMNALIKNKADQKLFLILKEISDLYDLEIDFEISAIKEGGLKDFIKFKFSKKTRSKLEKYKLPTYIAFLTVVTSILVYEYQHDDEKASLDKEETRLRIKKLERELTEKDNMEIFNDKNINEKYLTIEDFISLLFAYDKIKNLRSQYYEELLKVDKLDGISNEYLNEDNKNISIGEYISKERFKDFIITDNEIEPLVYENLLIEIIAPVIKKGNYKWKGYINGYIKNFNMKDDRFKSLIFNNKVVFDTGASIECRLVIRQKINSLGKVEIIEHNVYDVNRIFLSNNESIFIEDLE
jgi:hypothetical protein